MMTLASDFSYPLLLPGFGLPFLPLLLLADSSLPLTVNHMAEQRSFANSV